MTAQKCGLRRRLPLDRETIRGALHAHVTQSGLRWVSRDVNHVVSLFAPSDRPRAREDGQAVVLFLDELAAEGDLKWRTPPHEVARASACDQLWDLIEETLAEMWHFHELDGLAREPLAFLLATLWIDDAEKAVEDLETTLLEAPHARLRFELPDGWEDKDKPSEAARFVTEIDAQTVYLAVEQLDTGHGVTYDQLVDHFAMKNSPAEWSVLFEDGLSIRLEEPPLNEFAGLLKTWSEADILRREGGGGRERYRTTPEPPVGNAMTLYMRLWPWSRREQHRAYGPTEAGERVGLAKGTIGEHFKALRDASVITRGGEGYHPTGTHVAPWVAEILAELEATERAKNSRRQITVEQLVQRLSEKIRGEPFHELKREARVAAIQGAVDAGLIETDGGRVRPNMAAKVTVATEAWFALLACYDCAKPLAPQDPVVLETGGEADKWRWKTIRHANCDAAKERKWTVDHALGDVYDGEQRRSCIRCLVCDRGLWRVTGADLLKAHPTDGDATMRALRRLRHLVGSPRSRSKLLSSPSDGHGILNQLAQPDISFEQRMALLSHLLAYFEETDIVPPAPRRRWLSALAEFERQYHRDQTGLFRVFTIDEEDPHDNVGHYLRRATPASASGHAVLYGRGFRHLECPPSNPAS